MSAFLWMENHFAILTECLAGVRLEESCSHPPTRFIRGQQVGSDICVQTRDSVALYLWTLGRKSQSGSRVNIIIWTKSCVCVCVCVLLSTIAEFGKPTVSDEKLLPGEPGETQSRMGETGETQPGQDAGSLSRRNNTLDFWPLEPSHIPLPIMIPWTKYPLLNASKKIWVSVQDYLLFCSIFKWGESKVGSSSPQFWCCTEKARLQHPLPIAGREASPTVLWFAPQQARIPPFLITTLH